MKWLDILLDLCFPPKCPFCRKLLPSREILLCDCCQKELPWCPSEIQPVNFTKGCVSPLFYQDNVRESVHRYKFGGSSSYAAAYGLLMAQAAKDNWPDLPFDTVTWVPLSRRRRQRRGYDQAMLLAETVARQLSIPLCPTLEKVRHTPAQSRTADARARKINILDAYQVLPDTDLAGKRILLCDDVVTTGSTLEECARMLRMAGAQEVYAVTLARGKK